MKYDHRTKKRDPRPKGGFLYQLFAKPNRLPATAVREQDWETDDVPGIKLSTAFMVILFLHVAVVGGVMLFRFMEKDSGSSMAGNPRKAKAVAAAEAGGTGVRLDDPALKDLPTHRVRPHETVDMIATMHGVTREAVTRTNRLDTENPFRVGMTLVIPPAEKAVAAGPAGSSAQAARPGVPAKPEPKVAQARPVEEPRVAPARPVAEPAAPPRGSSTRAVLASTASPKPISNPQATRDHVLKSGETLWGLAKKYEVSVGDLLKANGITDAKKVRDGTKLRIPAKN